MTLVLIAQTVNIGLAKVSVFVYGIVLKGYGSWKTRLVVLRQSYKDTNCLWREMDFSFFHTYAMLPCNLLSVIDQHTHDEKIHVGTK